MNMRNLLIAAIGILPAGRLKNAALRRAGYNIAASAHIGPCLILGVGQLNAGEFARIGPLNVIRDLSMLDVGPHARIGRWNWISAAVPLRAHGASGSLTLGSHSALTQRHYVDCSGGIWIGAYSTVAGVRSTFITHGIDWRTAQQSFASITIGEYCILSSNVSVTPGTCVADRTVVGMGVTLSKSYEQSGLILQSRGRVVREDLEGEYFRRETGYIRGVRPAKAVDS